MGGGWGTPMWQGGALADGEVFVSEKSPEMARALITACRDLGIDTVAVRTSRGGFIAPEKVFEKARADAAIRDGWDF